MIDSTIVRAHQHSAGAIKKKKSENQAIGKSAEDREILPLRKIGKGTVIPSKNNAKNPRDYDKHLYKVRHLIENFFAKLKQYRGIATCYD